MAPIQTSSWRESFLVEFGELRRYDGRSAPSKYRQGASSEQTPIRCRAAATTVQLRHVALSRLAPSCSLSAAFLSKRRARLVSGLDAPLLTDGFVYSLPAKRSILRSGVTRRMRRLRESFTSRLPSVRTQISSGSSNRALTALAPSGARPGSPSPITVDS